MILKLNRAEGTFWSRRIRVKIWPGSWLRSGPSLSPSVKARHLAMAWTLTDISPALEEGLHSDIMFVLFVFLGLLDMF